jgi:hypothetical protein
MPDENMPFDPGVIPPNWGANIQPPPAPVNNLVPETPIQEAEVVSEPAVPVPQAPVTPTPEKREHKYRAVRGGGDQIFIIKDGKRHWVLNAQIYEKLGYRFGEEDRVEQSEIATYLPGETITTVNVDQFI